MPDGEPRLMLNVKKKKKIAWSPLQWAGLQIAQDVASLQKRLNISPNSISAGFFLITAGCFLITLSSCRVYV